MMPTNRKRQQKARSRLRLPCISLSFLALLVIYIWIEADFFSKNGSIYNESNNALKSLADFARRANYHGHHPPETKRPIRNPERTIAYAVSITHCGEDMIKVLDGPAVLSHSIHQNSFQNADSGSKYDYKLYAFVHPVAKSCTTHLPKLNYTVKVVETPIDVNDIKNAAYRERLQASSAGCCGEKEFLKLYSYTLYDHSIVVHLDADAIILRPMDDVFDLMLQPDTAEKNLTAHAMWPQDQLVSRRIHGYFTRDYPMGTHSMSVEHQGMQGGFWIVRPSSSEFEELKHLILEGNFSRGWYDGDVKYKGFYGAAMIQGLMGFFYSHIHPDYAIELNPCRYNNMAADPWDRVGARCKTPSVERCTDCRHVNSSDIYSHHFTLCGKPWWCKRVNPLNQNTTLCHQMFEKWFETRYHLETTVFGRNVSTGLSNQDDNSYGFCKGRKYSQMHSFL